MSSNKSRESNKHYWDMFYMLATDHYTRYLVILGTFESLLPEIVELKAKDNNLTMLFEDFSKIVRREELGHIDPRVDTYFNVDTESMAAKINAVDKKFKYLLTSFFLEL